MELWIRSQDKLQLLKVEDLEVYDGGNKANNHFFIRCLGDYVGEYTTKERALEVLNEIQEYIEKQGQIELNFVNGGKYYSKVYQMPQD